MKQEINKIIKGTKKQGFTLIETMIAITVMLVAVVAPMSLAQDGITAARLAQDQIVAFYLAQEGVEVVRNMRDYNKLNPAIAPNQLDGVMADCIVDPLNPVELGCYIDATEPDGDYFKTEPCPPSGCPVIKSNTERYTYNTTDPAFVDTKYTREIRLWYVGGSLDTKDAKVEVTVTWPFQQTTRSYTLQENLLDW